MEWMLLPLKRYADFEGRSQRKEYWMFMLGYVLAAIVLGFLVVIVRPVGLGLLGLLGLAIIVPSIAVQVRRFHDQDKSGWFVLLGFIPYIGWLIVVVFMCIEGTSGPNRFGADPKGGGEALHDVFA
jgi:uncharacterized membrane protein YhaH (DUF805 family)